MIEEPIDGCALARAPLAEIRSTLLQMPSGSTLQDSFAAVIRFVAVELIAGAVPEGMRPREATRRGWELLDLLTLLRK